MRLHRLEVEQVRGLAHAEVAFATTGVTVIEAPNETGKTTLFDALDVLLTEKQGTRRQRVRDLQPRGEDVASRITAELTLGPHHLTVTKQYNRDRATQLTIHAPDRRQLTGDEAHDQLRRLLEEHTDLQLWDALRFRQGRSLDPVTLSGTGALTRRLDASAGAGDGAGDDALYDRVLAEAGRYFTARAAKPTRLLTDADDAVAEVEEELARLRGIQQRLDAASERSTQLAADRRRLERRRAELEPELARRQHAAREVTALRTRLVAAEAELRTARLQEQQARDEVEARDDLAEAAATAARDAEKAAADAAAADAQVATLEERAGQLAAEVAAAEEALRVARVHHTHARTGADLETAREQLRDARDRAARVDAAIAAARQAEAALAATTYSQTRHAAVRNAADRVRLATAQLGAAAPAVTVSAHRDLRLRTEVVGTAAAPEDGTRPDDHTTLAAGGRSEHRVPDRLVLRIDDVATIEVVAGSSLEDRRTELAAAQEELAGACDRLGVDDPAAADALADAVAEHERAIAARDAVLQRELDEGGRDGLAARIRALEDRVSALTDRLSVSAAAEEELPRLELDAAGGVEQLDRLAAQERDAEEALATRRVEHQARQQALETARETAAAARATQTAATDTAERAAARLASARAVAGDEQLQTARAAATAATREAAAAVEQHRAALEALDADGVDRAVDNAQTQLDTVRDHLVRCQEEAAAVTATMEAHGGLGVGEAIQEAEAELTRRSRDRDGLWRRARAASALKETLEQAREAAYAAYRAPLADRIVAAGRLVFGPDLDVELDEDLRVVSRTLGGTTLEFAQLSAGAREQLAILSALAAADLAGEDGVPLVLDDTLGYTDPDRLERLGGVLGRISGPQVVVLTCVASRFEAIRGARVISLR